MGFDPDDTWGTVELNESLAGRRPGASAADKARELRADAPVRALASRLLRQHTDERAWSKGANGEKIAGFFLDRLGSDWHTVHDVPVGERSANIDHVVVGPGGVFTVNTKNLRGKVWLGPRTLLVNGHKTAYLPKASQEAARAGRYLSAALGCEVAVKGVLAIIADDWEIKERPSDVLVGSPGGVARTMRALPTTLGAREIVKVMGAALKPETWRGAAPAAVDESNGLCSCGGTWVERTRRADGAMFFGCSRFPRCRRTRT